MNIVSKLAWFGTVASVIGSFTVALHFLLTGYILFILGSVSWLYVGITRRDMSLVVLNGFFLTANLIGVYNAI